jgi:hypothetical protein
MKRFTVVVAALLFVGTGMASGQPSASELAAHQEQIQHLHLTNFLVAAGLEREAAQEFARELMESFPEADWAEIGRSAIETMRKHLERDVDRDGMRALKDEIATLKEDLAREAREYLELTCRQCLRSQLDCYIRSSEAYDNCLNNGADSMFCFDIYLSLHEVCDRLYEDCIAGCTQ